MHPVTPAVLGGKQFLSGLCYEQLFSSLPVRQATDAADTNGDHAMG